MSVRVGHVLNSVKAKDDICRILLAGLLGGLWLNFLLLDCIYRLNDHTMCVRSQWSSKLGKESTHICLLPSRTVLTKWECGSYMQFVRRDHLLHAELIRFWVDTFFEMCIVYSSSGLQCKLKWLILSPSCKAFGNIYVCMPDQIQVSCIKS